MDTYSAFYKAQAGIPESDIKILLIAGLTTAIPKKNDEIQIRGQWFKSRAVSKDPAEATWEIQAYEIADPTV